MTLCSISVGGAPPGHQNNQSRNARTSCVFHWFSIVSGGAPHLPTKTKKQKKTASRTAMQQAVVFSAGFQDFLAAARPQEHLNKPQNKKERIVFE